jgi:hypothetical protein
MTIDWLTFVPALVLLLTPGDLFNRGKVRYRDVSRDWHGYWGRTAAHGLHTIDFARAALGTWLLLDALHGAPDPRGFAKYEVVLLQGGIRLLAVLLQTVVCRKEDSIHAPFMFVIGGLVAGLSPAVALFAIVLATTVAMGAHSPAAFFPVLAAAHLGFGVWFTGKSAVLGLTLSAAAVAVPFLWAILFRRELIVAYRAKRHVTEHPSPLR